MFKIYLKGIKKTSLPGAVGGKKWNKASINPDICNFYDE
jgi:hypothetical protein